MIDHATKTGQGLLNDELIERLRVVWQAYLTEPDTAQGLGKLNKAAFMGERMGRVLDHIAAQEQRIAELEATPDATGVVQGGQWEPVPYKKISGDDPMCIRDGRIYHIDWEEWEGDQDTWPGSEWESNESVLAAMRPWAIGGDEDWLVMRQVDAPAVAQVWEPVPLAGDSRHLAIMRESMATIVLQYQMLTGSTEVVQLMRRRVDAPQAAKEVDDEG